MFSLRNILSIFVSRTDIWQNILRKENNRRKKRESKKKVFFNTMAEGPIQVGNVATPSNETDRLSYLHPRARVYKLACPVHAHGVDTCAYPTL